MIHESVFYVHIFPWKRPLNFGIHISSILEISQSVYIIYIANKLLPVKFITLERSVINILKLIITTKRDRWERYIPYTVLIII